MIKIYGNLKEVIKTNSPTTEALKKLYLSLDNIVFDESNYYALGEEYKRDELVREVPVAAPNRASVMVEHVKEDFWKDYIQDTILLDISYKDFLNVYQKAIAKENCDKVFDLNC